MLIEFDLLFAIVALLLILPVSLYQMLGGVSVSHGVLTRLNQNIISYSGTQKLAFQLSSIGGQQANVTYLVNGSQLHLFAYGSALNSSQIGAVRLVSVDGKLYYLSAIG